MSISAGLPDGTFSNQKIPIWVNFGGSGNGRCLYIKRPFVLFYVCLVNFVALWNILWLFGVFFRFGMLYQGKYGNPDPYVSQHEQL
jgi:hypothetical protein